jgi:hypothetical protein
VKIDGLDAIRIRLSPQNGPDTHNTAYSVRLHTASNVSIIFLAATFNDQ